MELAKLNNRDSAFEWFKFTSCYSEAIVMAVIHLWLYWLRLTFYCVLLLFQRKRYQSDKFRYFQLLIIRNSAKH